MSGSPFDIPHYLRINEVRWPLVERTVAALRGGGMTLDTALDLGCGPGWFSERLLTLGFKDVVGLDGREETVQEARARVPDACFGLLDFDAAAIDATPDPAAFVLAVGLLYHLQSPIRALRMFRRMTGSALLLETMAIPESEPMGRFVRESENITQGVQSCAIILSRRAIGMALLEVGYEHVYAFTEELDHPDFYDTPERFRRRCIYLATRSPVAVGGFTEFTERVVRADFWRR